MRNERLDILRRVLPEVAGALIETCRVAGWHLRKLNEMFRHSQKKDLQRKIMMGTIRAMKTCQTA